MKNAEHRILYKYKKLVKNRKRKPKERILMCYVRDSTGVEDKIKEIKQLHFLMILKITNVL